MTAFTFDESAHEYRLNGNRLCSVTEGLTNVQVEGVGLVDVRFCNERGRIRGKLVHQAVYYDFENDLDESTVDQVGLDVFQPGEFAGYIEAARKCRRELELEPFKPGEFETECGIVGPGLELPLYHSKELYAGCFDFAGTGVVKRTGRSKLLIDWKLGAGKLGYPIQTALYVNLLKKPTDYQRLKVRLFGDGTYKLEFHEVKDFYQHKYLGLSALALLKHKRAQNRG